MRTVICEGSMKSWTKRYLLSCLVALFVLQAIRGSGAPGWLLVAVAVAIGAAAAELYLHAGAARLALTHQPSTPGWGRWARSPNGTSVLDWALGVSGSLTLAALGAAGAVVLTLVPGRRPYVPSADRRRTVAA